MKINNKHWLDDYEPLETLKCPKNKEKFTEGQPDTIIIHYTASSSAEGSAKYLVRDDIKASAHLVIGRDGKIFQMVPFDTMSWHAGVSSFGDREGFNKYSIGIELDNAGVLEPVGGDYMAWFGKKYILDEVIEAQHKNEGGKRHWHIYTEKQLAVCQEVCQILIEKYGVRSVLGHDEISPGRKQDPGPAFPMEKFRNILLYHNRVSEEISEVNGYGEIIPEYLNIRSGPDLNFDTVSNPLDAGTKVKILEHRYGWYKVRTELEGWVKKDFVKMI